MKSLFSFLCVISLLQLRAEDGYRLWMRYDKVSNPTLLNQYKSLLQSPFVATNSATGNVVKEELNRALSGLLGTPIQCNKTNSNTSTFLCGTVAQIPVISKYVTGSQLAQAGMEGFVLFTAKIQNVSKVIVTANNDIGLLYGIFHLLRLMQTQQPINNLLVQSAPALKLRLLNHWDNLNRTVERGYAGFSLWNWHTLPAYKDERYKDYARANASIGINGTVLTNVNANAVILTPAYLEKVAALADIFRPYGIKVYLTARFSAPVEIGGLKTADPIDESVRSWWNDKVNAIYKLIPDFGGFLVKANSEGQPGPQNYGRTHADGANMLAAALAPHNGIVMWRAFVYSNETPDDRHKQAYNEFVPLDGKFASNVMVQVKNGAIDFQPREPFHPLFGAMPKTPLMMEFQVTQEYLGQATNLVYLGPLFKECLDSDTWSNGEGTTVAKIIDGNINNQVLNGMAGVTNTGNDINWCGHPFAQANWFALGRLEWDARQTSENIAEDWLRMTFTNDVSFVKEIKKMMLASREVLVNYMTPLGLHHLMGTGHHYGPAPWVSNLSRADWNPVYYHRADSIGIGFDRTSTGSNALSQYNEKVRAKWENVKTCPDEYLLWFHHLPWNYSMKSSRSLWDELCYRYYDGTRSVQRMQTTWKEQKGKVDEQRFEQVKMLLQIQADEAKWWRNACLLYFQTFSKMPIPAGYEQPDHTLDYYKSLRFPYAPGN